MRELSLQEAAFVAGGNDTINERVADACEGQPDSAVVTVTFNSSSGMGLGNIAERDTSTSTSVTVNCGDFRAEQQGSGS